MLMNYGVTIAQAAEGFQTFSNVMAGRVTYHFDENRNQYLRINADGTKEWLNWVAAPSVVPLFRRKK